MARSSCSRTRKKEVVLEGKLKKVEERQREVGLVDTMVCLGWDLPKHHYSRNPALIGLQTLVPVASA